MQNAAWSAPDPLALLARDLLSRSPGDRLPPVGAYQKRIGVGSGTVQARLRTLVESGAVRLEPRGHEGTYLVERDVTSLWAIARLGAVTGLMPLPEAIEPVALAVLLRRRFEELRIPLELLYFHGSAGRIDLVRAGRAHFALASRPAAEEAISAEPSRWTWIDLGPGSYHCEDSIVVLVRPHLGADDRITKIGVDLECSDHARLTEAEFPESDGYQYSPHPHARLPAAVAEGTIDAAIWLRTTPIIPLSAVGIAVRPLHRAAAIQANRELGRAVILWPSGSAEVGGVLRMIHPAGISSIQDELRRADSLPPY